MIRINREEGRDSNYRRLKISSSNYRLNPEIENDILTQVNRLAAELGQVWTINPVGIPRAIVERRIRDNMIGSFSSFVSSRFRSSVVISSSFLLFLIKETNPLATSAIQLLAQEMMREPSDGARAIPWLKCGSKAFRACGSNRKNLGRNRGTIFCFSLRRVSSLPFKNNVACIIERWLFLLYFHCQLTDRQCFSALLFIYITTRAVIQYVIIILRVAGIESIKFLNKKKK